MKFASQMFALAASLALVACGSDAEPTSQTNEADAFAARIGGGQTTANADATADASSDASNGTGRQPAPVLPGVEQPRPAPVQGAYAPGTASDPAATTCDATSMAPFFGLVADTRTRIDIEDAAGPGREIRFVRPDGPAVTPNPDSPRLNIMLDAQDVIRDARCG